MITAFNTFLQEENNGEQKLLNLGISEVRLKPDTFPGTSSKQPGMGIFWEELIPIYSSPDIFGSRMSKDLLWPTRNSWGWKRALGRMRRPAGGQAVQPDGPSAPDAGNLRVLIPGADP